MPKITPTATDTPKAIRTEAVVTMVFHSAVREISQARKKPKPIPKTAAVDVDDYRRDVLHRTRN
jgi:hypothetical protein